MKKTILYIGDFKFSEINAECELVLGNSFLLRELGYDVVFIGNDQKSITGYDKYIEYDENKIYNLNYKKNSSDVINIFSLNKQLIEIINIYKPRMVICYGSLSLSIHLLLLKKFCNKNGIKFVVNCVDLPIINNGNIISKSVRKVDRIIRNKIYKNADGLIAVSELISKKICNRYCTVILPPIRKKTTQSYKIEEKENISFMYAGVPFPLDGRKLSNGCYKDRLDIAVELFAKLEKEKFTFIFDIYGLTKEDYIKAIPHQKELVDSSKSIIFHGKISKDICDKEILKHDFMVLLRDENRTSLAGFSTKVVDSISLGTPVILNPIGDVNKYLIDGFNSIFVEGCNNKNTLEQFKKIVIMDREKISILKHNCLTNSPFYYMKYYNEMKFFLEEVM